MELHNLDHLRTHGEEALEISLPLPILSPSPLAGEGQGEGGSAPGIIPLPLPAQADGDAVRGCLPGLFCPFRFDVHGQ